MDELNYMTKKREMVLKDLGYQYKCIWEHECNRQLKNDAAMREYISNLDITDRLILETAYMVVEIMQYNYFKKFNNQEKLWNTTILLGMYACFVRNTPSFPLPFFVFIIYFFIYGFCIQVLTSMRDILLGIIPCVFRTT